MLVLSRKSGESIVVPGRHITITVVRVRGNRVQLGITAPSEEEVHRDEVWQQRSAELYKGIPAQRRQPTGKALPLKRK